MIFKVLFCSYQCNNDVSNITKSNNEYIDEYKSIIKNDSPEIKVVTKPEIEKPKIKVIKNEIKIKKKKFSIGENNNINTTKTPRYLSDQCIIISQSQYKEQTILGFMRDLQ
jgi:hypothetical protein